MNTSGCSGTLVLSVFSRQEVLPTTICSKTYIRSKRGEGGRTGMENLSDMHFAAKSAAILLAWCSVVLSHNSSRVGVLRKINHHYFINI